MTTTTNAENLQQYKNSFSFIVQISRYWLSLRALNCLEKLRFFLQILNEFHNDVPRYRKH